MRVTVKATPGGKHVRVERIDATHYAITVTAPAEHGKATDAVRRELAKALCVAPSRISLVMGSSSRVKVFDVR